MTRDDAEMAGVVKKMEKKDWPKVHKDLFADVNRTKFEALYSLISSKNFLEMKNGNDDIDQAIRDMYGDPGKAAFLKAENSKVHNAMDRKRRSPLGDPDWPT